MFLPIVLCSTLTRLNITTDLPLHLPSTFSVRIFTPMTAAAYNMATWNILCSLSLSKTGNTSEVVCSEVCTVCTEKASFFFLLPQLPMSRLSRATLLAHGAPFYTIVPKRCCALGITFCFLVLCCLFPQSISSG